MNPDIKIPILHHSKGEHWKAACIWVYKGEPVQIVYNGPAIGNIGLIASPDRTLKIVFSEQQAIDYIDSIKDAKEA